MKESEYLTSLAQECWDTDQVLFARGLPRNWLPVSELAECSEVKMWESVDFSICASNHVLEWRNDWLWCKRTSGPREAKLETSINSTLCWWKKQHARGLLSTRWLTSWPTKAIYWYVTTKVCDAKFEMYTEHTSNSDFGAVILVCHGQTPPRSSPNSKTRKDSSSTRQQETRVTFSTILAHASPSACFS